MCHINLCEGATTAGSLARQQVQLAQQTAAVAHVLFRSLLSLQCMMLHGPGTPWRES
jgi:hypothetical protein